MDTTEKKICAYSSLLIALLFAVIKLLSARNRLVLSYWHFDLLEVLFQFVAASSYCYLLFAVNLRKNNRPAPLTKARRLRTSLIRNVLIAVVFSFAAGGLQYILFRDNHLNRNVFWINHFLHFFLATAMVAVMIRILLLMRENRSREIDYQRLNTVYLQSELELLKEQLTPHFLFNALSNLSGVVMENTGLAQQYIGHLAKISRYALRQPHDALITVSEELEVTRSFARLLEIRYRGAFEMYIQVDEGVMARRLPHLSLQPLIENASKHNMATAEAPLRVNIRNEGNCIVVSNNRRPFTHPKDSTGLGLINLKQRYHILTGKEIEIEQGQDSYTVKLPLLV